MRGIQDITAFDSRNHPIGRLGGDHVGFRCPDDGDVRVEVNFRGNQDGHYKFVFRGRIGRVQLGERLKGYRVSQAQYIVQKLDVRRS